MNSRLIVLCLFFLVGAPAEVLSADGDAEPAAQQWPVKPLAEVGRHRAPELDREELAREDVDRLEQGLPYRFALPEEVSLTLQTAGTWETLPTGRELWRLRVSGGDVLSLNLGFTKFWLPPDARLLVYDAAQVGSVQSYDESDNAAHGELWTAVLLTSEVVVELEVDTALRWQVELELTSIGRGYRLFGEDRADKSGFCNNDVVCPEGDPWREEIASVGGYSYEGSLFCTGFMINNTEQDGTPYFMTAYHCDVRGNLPATLVVYWNFESPQCGDHGGGSLDNNQRGATLRAEYFDSDMALLELDDLPDPAFGVRYAGWDKTDRVSPSAVCIHHPSGHEKSISFEDDPLAITSYQGMVSPGDGTHLRVRDWDDGTTERGSSGSPLFDDNHHVVGQLHGGGAACGNNEPDWYGWFHVSWDGGGSSGNRLSDWLDPLGTGDLTVDTIDPFGTSFTVAPVEGFESSGVQGGTFDPLEMVYTLTNTGEEVAEFTAAVSASWATVSPESGAIAVGGSVEVSVNLASSVSTLSVGRHQSTLQIVNSGSGAGTTERTLTVTVVSNEPRLTGVVPNPFGHGGFPVTEIRYTLGGSATVTARVYDLRGGRVKDLGSMVGVAGENHFSWDGYNDLGGASPSGKYVFVLNALGQELRTNIVLVR